MEEALLRQTRNLIASRIGLLLREQDDALLCRVVAERVRALNLHGAEQYCQWLGSDAGIRHEREALVIPLTTGETYFFRDSGQQEAIAANVARYVLSLPKIAPALEKLFDQQTENTAP